MLNRISNPLRNEKTLSRIVIYRCNNSNKYKYLILWDDTLEYGMGIVPWSETVGPNNVHLLIDKLREQRKPKIISEPGFNDVFDTFVKANGNPVFIRRIK